MKFQLGNIVATRRAVEELSPEFILSCIRRHANGDYGELGAEDVRANEMALVHGDRVLSKYSTTTASHVYVITEHDRSLTTLLFTDEY
jgi:hypothetical protein